MDEKKVVELKKDENVSDQTTNQQVVQHNKLWKAGIKEGVVIAMKAVGKGLMYVGIGTLTVFGVFAILGKAGVLKENETVDVVENEDGSFTVQEATTQPEGSTEE